jgi:hypothetical protein
MKLFAQEQTWRKEVAATEDSLKALSSQLSEVTCYSFSCAGRDIEQLIHTVMNILDLVQSQDEVHKVREELKQAKVDIQRRDVKLKGSVISFQQVCCHRYLVTGVCLGALLLCHSSCMYMCWLQVSDKLATSEDNYASLLAKCSISPDNSQATNRGALMWMTCEQSSVIKLILLASRSPAVRIWTMYINPSISLLFQEWTCIALIL